MMAAHQVNITDRAKRWAATGWASGILYGLASCFVHCSVLGIHFQTFFFPVFVAALAVNAFERRVEPPTLNRTGYSAGPTKLRSRTSGGTRQ